MLDGADSAIVGGSTEAVVMAALNSDYAGSCDGEIPSAYGGVGGTGSPVT